MYNNEPEKNKLFCFFCVDSGVDTGDIVNQGTSKIEKGGSYFTMSWKGMGGIKETQTKTILKIQNQEIIETKKITPIDENTIFTHPTIFFN